MNKSVVSDPDVMMGKPVIAGTRITVESILERLGAGESTEQLVESHPRWPMRPYGQRFRSQLKP